MELELNASLSFVTLGGKTYLGVLNAERTLITQAIECDPSSVKPTSIFSEWIQRSNVEDTFELSVGAGESLAIRPLTRGQKSSLAFIMDQFNLAREISIPTLENQVFQGLMAGHTEGTSPSAGKPPKGVLEKPL